jgi:hypothetical protein
MTVYMSYTVGVLWEVGTAYPSRAPESPPVFGVVRVTHLSSFLCCYFALFVSLLCLVPRLLCLYIINVCFVCLPAVSCPTMALFIDYQCLISPSLFSNVYLHVMLSIRFPSIVRYTRCHCV